MNSCDLVLLVRQDIHALKILITKVLRYLLSLLESDKRGITVKEYAGIVEQVLEHEGIAFKRVNEKDEVNYEIIGKGGLACWITMRSSGSEDKEVTLAVCIPFASLPETSLLPFYRACLEQNEYLIGCALSIFENRLRVVSEREAEGLDSIEVRNLIFQSFDTAYRKGRLLFDEFGAEPLFRVNWTRQNSNQSSPLRGDELLNKVRSLGDVSKSDLVRACGYCIMQSDGTERLDFTAFYEALLEAKGLTAAPEGVDGVMEDSRQLTYTCSIQNDGSLILYKPYTLLLDLLPGDKFYVVLSESGLSLRPFGVDAVYESTISDNMNVTVDQDNNILIPPSTLGPLGCSAGQDFEIKLGRSQIRLVLVQNEVE